ncbi:CBS domain-containing protein, partial [bacterium]|nr:CBS domain-containing protein [bacterium]
MSGLENLYVSPEDALRRAMEVINNGRRGMALVVDDEGRLLGTLTDGDLRRHLLRGGGQEDAVDTFFCREPITAQEGYDRAELIARMERRGIKLVPLLANGRPVKLLTPADLAITDRPAILGGSPLFEKPLPFARPTLPPFEELTADL